MPPANAPLLFLGKPFETELSFLDAFVPDVASALCKTDDEMAHLDRIVSGTFSAMKSIKTSSAKSLAKTAGGTTVLLTCTLSSI